MNEFINMFTKELIVACKFFTVIICITGISEVVFANRSNYLDITFILGILILDVITLAFIGYNYINALPLNSYDIVLQILNIVIAILNLKWHLKFTKQLTELAERKTEISLPK